MRPRPGQGAAARTLHSSSAPLLATRAMKPWRPNACCRKPHQLVHLEAAAARGVALIRRFTGGGTGAPRGGEACDRPVPCGPVTPACHLGPALLQCAWIDAEAASLCACSGSGPRHALHLAHHAAPELARGGAVPPPRHAGELASCWHAPAALTPAHAGVTDPCSQRSSSPAAAGMVTAAALPPWGHGILAAVSRLSGTAASAARVPCLPLPLQYTEELYGTVFGPHGPFRLRENGEARWHPVGRTHGLAGSCHAAVRIMCSRPFTGCLRGERCALKQRLPQCADYCFGDVKFGGNAQAITKDRQASGTTATDHERPSCCVPDACAVLCAGCSSGLALAQLP